MIPPPAPAGWPASTVNVRNAPHRSRSVSAADPPRAHERSCRSAAPPRPTWVPARTIVPRRLRTSGESSVFQTIRADRNGLQVQCARPKRQLQPTPARLRERSRKHVPPCSGWVRPTPRRNTHARSPGFERRRPRVESSSGPLLLCASGRITNAPAASRPRQPPRECRDSWETAPGTSSAVIHPVQKTRA